MKNIRNYSPEKYNSSEYEKIEEGIYKISKPVSTDNYLVLLDIPDDIKEKISLLTTWEKAEGSETVEYEGKKYYRSDSLSYKEIDQRLKDFYVTSLMFEQEPEYGENDPSSDEISLYPLRDILEKFFCYCNDFYEEENEKDKINSYQEFESDSIEDIKNLRSIIGKHVYNKEVGEYVELIIE